ncbi:MAG: acyltransferase [bacterium]|nr:acyltransferase [bacterium]
MSDQSSIATGRSYFLDNVRTFIIFLVIVYHSGGVYESTGMWEFFWIVDDPATNNISGLLGLILDIFMMSTLFLISGYLTPTSVATRSGWAFVKSKFRRLIHPWIFGVLFLIPIYKVIFLYSRGLPQEGWMTYFHVNNGVIHQSWLWFLPLLFAFNVLYLLLSRSNISVPDISLKQGVLSVFVLGWVYGTCMDIFGFRGWTLTSLVDFQNERILIYFMFFLLGALCFKLKAFDVSHSSKRLYNIVNSTSWIPILIYITFLIFPLVNPGEHIVSEIIDRAIVWFFFQLSLFSLVYTVIESFRRFRDKKGTIASELNKNSYYVYVIHVVVLGGIALVMLKLEIPSLMKYLILFVSTFVVSNLIVSAYRRARLLTHA